MQTLIIPGSLAGRNESEAAARGHWTSGARLKKQNTEIVMWCAVSQHIKPYKQRVLVEVVFYEKDLKRDEDNIIGGIKYILDGLVWAKVLPNDTRQAIALNIKPVKTDRNNPRIEVNLMEAADNENNS